MKNYNDLDGSIENFDAVNAINNAPSNYVENFSLASGWIQRYDAVNASNNIGSRMIEKTNFYPADGEDYSNFIPLLAGAATQTRAGQRVFKGTILDKKERAKRRERRQARKDMEAQGKLEAVRGLAKGAEADKALLKAIAPQKTPQPEKKGLSVGAKIGIGVGVVAILGIGAYFLLRKKK